MAHYRITQISDTLRVYFDKGKIGINKVTEFGKEKVKKRIDIGKTGIRRKVDETFNTRFHIGSVRDEIYNRLQGDPTEDLGVTSVVGIRDEIKTVKEYTYGNLQRAVNGINWDKVENLVEKGKASEILKTGGKGAVLRSGKFAYHTSVSKFENALDSLKGDGTDDVGVGAVLDVRDKQRTTLDAAVITKNTAETTYKGSKFTYKYLKTHADLIRAKYVLRTTKYEKPPRRASARTRATYRKNREILRVQRRALNDVRVSKLRIKSMHKDIYNHLKHRITAPYRSFKETLEKTHHIARIGGKGTERAARGAYQYTKSGVQRAYNFVRNPVDSVRQASRKNIIRTSPRFIKQTARYSKAFSRFALKPAKILSRGVARIASRVAAKFAALLAKLVAAVFANPIALAIIIIVLAVALLLFWIFSTPAVVYPSAMIMAEEETFLDYRDEIRRLDAEFEEKILKVIEEVETAKKSHCREDTTLKKYDEFVVNLHGVVNASTRISLGNWQKGLDDLKKWLDQEGIKTDWQAVLALSAVVHEQDLNFEEHEQEFISKVYHRLNRMVSEDEYWTCSPGCYSWSVCHTSCSNGGCTTRCTTHYCCHGHYKKTLNIYVYSLDYPLSADDIPDDIAEEIPDDIDIELDKDRGEGNRLEIVHTYFIEENETGEKDWANYKNYLWKYEWWKHLATYDIEEQYPDVRTKPWKYTEAGDPVQPGESGAPGGSGGPPPGLPEDWPVEKYGYPPSWPLPPGWKPEGWPEGIPFIWPPLDDLI